MTKVNSHNNSISCLNECHNIEKTLLSQTASTESSLGKFCGYNPKNFYLRNSFAVITRKILKNKDFDVIITSLGGVIYDIQRKLCKENNGIYRYTFC